MRYFFEEQNAFCMSNNFVLPRMHQLIEFIGDIIALLWQYIIQVHHNILRTEVVRIVGERGKDKYILPLAQMRIEVIACRDAGIWRNLIQEQLNMLLAATRTM